MTLLRKLINFKFFTYFLKIFLAVISATNPTAILPVSSTKVWYEQGWEKMSKQSPLRHKNKWHLTTSQARWSMLCPSAFFQASGPGPGFWECHPSWLTAAFHAGSCSWGGEPSQGVVHSHEWLVLPWFRTALRAILVPEFPKGLAGSSADLLWASFFFCAIKIKINKQKKILTVLQVCPPPRVFSNMPSAHSSPYHSLFQWHQV